ncbi:MAG TPA: alpha-1,4-glucan--maltose-1-phosphate maltosyltransferase [Kofleriaceae bacterium]|nr:alpha-1,4-glucan--maltose-1-phosphate maltosyltransferase [Kofleriaceae bacterium]
MDLENGRCRVVIEGISPQIDGGRYPIKRIVGDSVSVRADVITDGHDLVAGCVRYRPVTEDKFVEVPLAALVNDRWQAAFTVDSVGRWEYAIEAWIDGFATWCHDLERRVAGGTDITVDLLIGARLLGDAAKRATADDKTILTTAAAAVADSKADPAARAEIALAPELASAMARNPDRSLATRTATFAIVVDRPRAGFSAWYELFPRSFGPPGAHGTFADAEKVLPYVASMGFDVLYLPPVHPIGRAHRKGKNNSLTCEPGEPGSPWAIGDETGGHKAVHPDLGTLADFDHFVRAAAGHGLEVAIDIAFQASPDHPYVTDHEEWFIKRPDGTIQYAENPPKKYQDVYPFNFESEAWRSMWEELCGIFSFWIGHGIKIFRVDNPHTKALAFWEWAITRIKAEHPDVLFLAEAFTRPKVMYALAKRGFSQSYTYFTWRTTKHELTEYLEELVNSDVSEVFRPNFWPNTPDILPEHLQHGGRAVFCTRLVLAATLSSSYGIYGPAFELMENVPRAGSGEYINNEKYELRHWDIDRADSLRHVIARINEIRREHPALHNNHSLEFHHTDNDEIVCYSKQDRASGDAVLVVVNLDPHHTQSAWVTLDLESLGIDGEAPYQLHDLLGEGRFLWHGAKNFVKLDPHEMPAHIFYLKRRSRREQDFEYFA